MGIGLTYGGRYMKRNIVYSLCLTLVFGSVNAQFAAAQTKTADAETPFTLILEPSSKSGQAANMERRKTVSVIAGRRMKPGMRGFAYKDEQDGTITLAGPNSASGANADQLVYKISSNSSRARSLIAGIETRYGQPDIQKPRERIWYIKNPNVQLGQAKIITLTVSDKAGQLTINADRMPITRRGELLVKPLRKRPKQNVQKDITKTPAAKPRIDHDPS